jgi:glyoxylate reductase
MSVIVTARQLPEMFMAQLESIAECRVFDAGNPAASLEGASVWVGTAMDPVTPELIEQFPASLGLIANLGVGTDNIDLAAAAGRGVAVSNTPVVTGDTADLAMALMLATCRRTGECERALRANDWAAGASLLGTRVHGKTLGIVGFGAIGQAVARRARGFDMKVLYHGPSRKLEAEMETGAVFCEDIHTLLAESDILSLHCPLTTDTKHLIDASALSQMPRHGILINTGRGPLVDEAALAQALADGVIAGAGLDVFEFEPEINPKLMGLDKVVLLPHIGSGTMECRRDMAMRALANIRAFLESGAPLDNCLNAIAA